jgi:Cu(I)/Ag(I) efflux system membrane fusion protein/cobalt-zinc-cadmium efflux system membrane fusion protein
MSPARRGKVWWGLGTVLILGVLAVAYVSGVLPGFKAKETRKPLCWVSPKDPGYIKEAPGKDPEGHELVPVYPTRPGAPPGPAVAPAPQAERQAKAYHCPMHPEVISSQPGKCPKCGMDLAPFHEEHPAAPAAKPERQVKHWVSPMDPKYVRDKPGKDPMGMDLVPVYAEGVAPAKKERKIKYWVSPMDPGYVRDKPGKAPCGMDLVPVYEEEGGEAAPGVIAVSPQTVQSMGVRTAKVEVRPLTHDTWAVGLVTFNERNLAIVNTKVTGWVERLYINATGDPVRKGQPLLSIYSPDLVSAQDEYLLALRNLKNLEKSPYPEMADGAKRLAAASRRRLEYFDISAGQIETLKNTGRVKKHLVLASPARGIVTKRMVTQGQMVQAGMPLLEVADLATIWVDADIYQYELPWIKLGQKVEMSLQYLPGETFPGQIEYIYPYLKDITRTARVRLRFPNPQLKLKPEMFSQVQIKSPVTKDAVVVPTEAVMDTGLKQHVFIALGGGKFEPREVKLGVFGNGNNYREVLSGLKGGEEIVTSAQFLLDSESRFREAIQMMLAPQQPEKGKEAAPAAPGAPPAPMPPGHKH